MAAIEQPNSGRGRRCDLGCESWPDEDAYKECPTCGEPTTRYTNTPPTMTPDEAASALRHANFEKWLDAHGRR